MKSSNGSRMQDKGYRGGDHDAKVASNRRMQAKKSHRSMKMKVEERLSARNELVELNPRQYELIEKHTA